MISKTTTDRRMDEAMKRFIEFSNIERRVRVAARWHALKHEYGKWPTRCRFCADEITPS